MPGIRDQQAGRVNRSAIEWSKDGSTQLFDSEQQPGKRVPYLPIIPLCGTAAAEMGRRAFPRLRTGETP